MKYSLMLSIILYVCGCVYIVFGACTIAKNANNKVNRLFLLLTISLAIWSFSHSISNSAATAEESAFCRSFSVFGWGIFSSILLHLILVLAKTESRLNKRILYGMIYLPAFINIISFGPFGYFFEKQYKMVQTDFGWMNMAPMYYAGIWLNLYYIIFSIVSLILLICWWRKLEPHTAEKRLAKHFLISIILLFFIEAVIDMLPDILDKKFFPKLPVLFLLVPTIILFAVLKKFELLSARREKIPMLRGTDKSGSDRLRLFRTAAVIFMFGGAISFLVGYFGKKGSLGRELLYAAALLLFGVFTRIIPFITKKHAVQNTIFLVICSISTFYIMIVNARIGALTVWSVYILFFLFNVIFDQRILAIIFTAFCIVIQIVFWIIYPKVSVTINGNEYAIRIIIILFSYFSVRYLTSEYAYRVKEYQMFAREQEILEQISTNFISINRDNVKRKIDEMLEMADEILEFSHAYLVKFSKNYKEATILNMRVKDTDKESFLYRPGLKFKTATFPLVKSLIAQGTPMICEDTKKASFDECGEVKNFFMSKGINSFFALPILVDEKIDGMLVIEYYDRIDLNLAKSRLYFLNIIVNIMGDTRKKLLYERRLYNSAYFDKNTKLANRNMLKKKLQQTIHNRKESGKIAVLVIELANLRIIKDTFGHSVGEKVMVKSATILKNMLEDCCDIARSGEGKFVVVLPDVENTEQIEDCANRILASFSDPILTETKIEALFVVICIGISVYPDHGRDADTILKNTDLAGYEARNSDQRVLFYNSQMENNIAENTLFTNRLFKSLQNDEFFLEFQPQISCVTGKTVGIEALLRWTSDGNKRVPPDRFIPILEQTGLIYDVGLWVLEQTLQEHNRLMAKGFPPLRVSVNLSVVQFQGEEFISDFTRIIEKSGVDPQYIELEITESLFSKDPADVLDKTYQLKELGISIAIDDFGREYSSLNRLNLVPFDRLKIDKDIINYINLEEKRAPITKTIIMLAKDFRAGIIAEGVETKEQADFLRSIDCDEIQGYYFSRPLSSKALEEFLKRE
ncbi:MAG TPA: EAL domain-containing protein [Clostridiaceae bacterium]|nr:EAL domain-containing protein [Clostridiaceae bacterium]